MQNINQEVNALVSEMDSVKNVKDEIFIEFYDKEKELQKRLNMKAESGELSSEDKKQYSQKLTEAFERLQSRISFCTLE